jgi:hypothetical protein
VSPHPSWAQISFSAPYSRKRRNTGLRFWYDIQSRILPCLGLYSS